MEDEIHTILEITEDKKKLGDINMWNLLLQDDGDVKLAHKTGFFTTNWLHLYDNTHIKHVYIVLSITSTVSIDHITGIAVGVIYNTHKGNRTVWIDWLWSDQTRPLKGRGASLLHKLEEKLLETLDAKGNIYVIALDSCIGFYLKYGYQPIKYATHSNTSHSDKDILAFSKPCKWQLMMKGISVYNVEVIGNDLHEYN